jgi:dynein heavy chain
VKHYIVLSDLDKRLQAADDKIDQFNIEETHFGWETTVYPLKMELVKQLSPFLRLYEMTVEFNEKYKYVLCLFVTIHL